LRSFLTLTKGEQAFYSVSELTNIALRLFFEASDPAKISTGFGSQTYFHAVGGSGPLTFISTVMVGDCHLMDPKLSGNGKLQKFIEGAGIEGEWERLVGAIGQVINKVEYRAQIQAGYVSFSTSFTDSGMLLVKILYCQCLIFNSCFVPFCENASSQWTEHLYSWSQY
jgi:hypothetical protein